MLCRTQFVGSGCGRVGSLVLINEPEFGMVQSLVFPDLGLGSACFWLNKFKVRAFLFVFKYVRSSVLVDKGGFM